MALHEELQSRRGNLQAAHKELVLLPTELWLPEEDSRYSRRAILVGSAVRLSEMVRAIELLSDNGFDEEVCAVSRMLIEVVVNAAYLQVADEAELNSYLHFDSQYSLNKLSMSEFAEQDEASRSDREMRLEAARNKTGRKDTALSWSKRQLVDRAELAEQVVKLPVLVNIVRNVTASVNFSVHGTLLSLGRSLCPLIGLHEDAMRQSRLKFHVIAVSFADLALQCFVKAFVNTLALDVGAVSGSTSATS